MCVMSMIMDHYGDKWENHVMIPYPPLVPQPPIEVKIVPPVTPEEVEEFRELLERARKYDKEHNEPNCELESKKQKIRDLAKELGVDVSFIDEK